MIGEEQEMIYPIDVHRQAQKSSKLPDSDKYKLIAGLFLIGCVILAFALHWLLGTFFQFPGIVATLATILAAIVMVILVFRFIIFQESSRMQEYEEQESDSFSKYVRIRRDSETTVQIAPNTQVQYFEYNNGNCVCTLQFKYGINDQTRSQTTEKVFAQIFHILAEYNLAYRTIDVVEDFEKSEEYDNYVYRLNSISDKKLARHLLRVANNVFDKCKEESVVPTVYLMIITSGEAQAADLDVVLRQIFSLCRSNLTAFRRIKCLDLQHFNEMCLEFYGLETIDLSIARKVSEVSAETQNVYSELISLYSISGSKGTKKNDALLERDFRSNAKKLSGE